MNPFSTVNWRPNLEERRRFALSLVVGFPCVALVLLVGSRLHSPDWNLGFPLALGGAGAALGLLLWVVPQIAWPFYVAWYGVACCAGLFIGNLLLASVYLLMFAPVGLAMRALGRSPIRKRFDRNAPTYWRDARTPDDPEQYYRQF